MSRRCWHAFSSALRLCHPLTVSPSYIAKLRTASVASVRQLSTTTTNSFLATYVRHEDERRQLGIPAKPLSASQVLEVTNLLENDSLCAADGERLLDLLKFRVPPGVDEAAYVKAAWLASIVS